MDGSKRVMVAKERTRCRKHSNGSGISLAGGGRLGVGCIALVGIGFLARVGIGSQRNRINGLSLLPSEYDRCICK